MESFPKPSRTIEYLGTRSIKREVPDRHPLLIMITKMKKKASPTTSQFLPQKTKNFMDLYLLNMLEGQAQLPKIAHSMNFFTKKYAFLKHFFSVDGTIQCTES